MKKSRFFRMITIAMVLAALMAVMGTQVSAAELTGRLEGVPEELEYHVLLQHRGNGDCEEMTGSTMTLFLFVDDLANSWTQAEIDTYFNTIHDQIAQIQNTAAAYNAYPEFSVYYGKVTSQKELTDGDAINSELDNFVKQVGLTGWTTANEELEEEYNVDDAAIFLVLNREGRAYAYWDTTGAGAEFAVLFRDASAFWHEMNHLFGAVDFYYPAEVKAAADLYLGESIMTVGAGGIVDELTAYLIGWTDELYSCGRGFLYETAWITQEYINQSLQAETFTGYTVKTNEYGTYEGYMENGLYHIYGTYTWNDGGKYTGEYDHGYMTGYGTFYWNDGTVYEGYFVKGALQGYGTMTYANGYTLTGYWENSQFVG